jgi:hypothetical protein
LLLAHFGVRALMHEAALEQKIEATDLSFVHAYEPSLGTCHYMFLFFLGTTRSCSDHSCMNSPRSDVTIARTVTLREQSTQDEQLPDNDSCRTYALVEDLEIGCLVILRPLRLTRIIHVSRAVVTQCHAFPSTTGT